uniref:Uncharacterized protein n=1 Tax=Timema shepardi TaxID=629360 RepID=A0A7R9G108_TIMSH|nr:unnamed protein product [Timema shepardi]
MAPSLDLTDDQRFNLMKVNQILQAPGKPGEPVKCSTPWSHGFIDFTDFKAVPEAEGFKALDTHHTSTMLTGIGGGGSWWYDMLEDSLGQGNGPVERQNI